MILAIQSYRGLNVIHAIYKQANVIISVRRTAILLSPRCRPNDLHASVLMTLTFSCSIQIGMLRSASHQGDNRETRIKYRGWNGVLEISVNEPAVDLKLDLPPPSGRSWRHVRGEIKALFMGLVGSWGRDGIVTSWPGFLVDSCDGP